MKYGLPLRHSPEGFHDEMDRVEAGKAGEIMIFRRPDEEVLTEKERIKAAGNRWCVSANPAAFL